MVGAALVMSIFSTCMGLWDSAGPSPGSMPFSPGTDFGTFVCRLHRGHLFV